MHVALRVRATYEDALSRRSLTSAPTQIAQAAQVTANVSADGTVALNTRILGSASVQDANNNPADSLSGIEYIWRSGSGASGTVLPNGGSSVFILTNATRLSVAQAGNLYLQVRATDSLGYVTESGEVQFSGGGAVVEQIREYSKVALNVFNLLESQAVVGALGSHLDGVGGGGGADSLLEINGVRFAESEDIATALAARTADSLHSDKDFALDNFAWSQFGAAGNNGAPAWSAWVRGGWGALEGAPVINGDKFRYEGKQFGVYGGYDRQFGDNIRAGLRRGRSEVEIKADFQQTPAGGLDDRVRRELQSLLPYAEWKKGAVKLRVIGGIGRGELLIRESGAGGCQAELDVNGCLAACRGNINSSNPMIGQPRWSAICHTATARQKRDGARTTPRNCRGLPAAGGEFLFGGRAAYRGVGFGGAYFAPRVGLDARKLFGDASDDLAYDLSGALTFGRENSVLSFDVEGRWQVNDTTAHQRNSVGAQVSYRRGSVQSSLRTRAERKEEDALRLSHRLEFGYAEARGGNNLGGNLYVERAIGEQSPGTAVGGEIILGF